MNCKFVCVYIVEWKADLKFMFFVCVHVWCGVSLSRPGLLAERNTKCSDLLLPSVCLSVCLSLSLSLSHTHTRAHTHTHTHTHTHIHTHTHRKTADYRGSVLKSKRGIMLWVLSEFMEMYPPVFCVLMSCMYTGLTIGWAPVCEDLLNI